MTEGALDGLSGSVLSDGTFSDDGRAFLAIERRMNIVKAVNLHKTATVAQTPVTVNMKPLTNFRQRRRGLIHAPFRCLFAW